MSQKSEKLDETKIEKPGDKKSVPVDVEQASDKGTANEAEDTGVEESADVSSEESLDEFPEESEESEESLEQQLAAAKEQAEKHKEDFLLASAEAENIRKRAQNEIVSARKFAIEKFASELLSVRDSLDLAIAAEIDGVDNEAAGEAIEKMHEGLALTLKQFDAVFEKFGISVIEPKGEKFNPDHHQAMAAVESKDMAPNHVVDVMQKGYLLNDRLLRPAMVVVSKAPAASAEDADK